MCVIVNDSKIYTNFHRLIIQLVTMLNSTTGCLCINFIKCGCFHIKFAWQAYIWCHTIESKSPMSEHSNEVSLILNSSGEAVKKNQNFELRIDCSISNWQHCIFDTKTFSHFDTTGWLEG